MIRFRDLRLRGKLGITFLAVVLPLLAAELLAIALVATSLRDAAEVELTNVVHHFYRLCDAQHLRQASLGREPHGGPSAGDIAFIRDVTRSLKVGQTGYAYAMTLSGDLVVHPVREGVNIADSRDTKGFHFIRHMTAVAPALPPGAVGTIRYPWQNPEAGELAPRMKILKYMYFKPWGWVIAAGTYEEEVFAAVGRLSFYTAPLIIMSVVLVVVLTLGLSRLITRPLRRLSEAAAHMASGDLRHRVAVSDAQDEIASLGRVFDAMAGEIAEKTAEMERLIDERTRALRESREKYKRLVESSIDGIVTTDLKGIVTFVNGSFETLVGLPRESILGRPISEFYRHGRDQARAIMRELRQSGSIRSLETELVAEGRVIPIRTSASLLRDGEGRADGTLGIFADITAEKKLAQELREAQAHLVQSMKLRALGDLVSGVAHEINNPLMASSTTLHVMLAAPCPEGCKNRGRMDVLVRCNARIAKIVNHLREFSRQAPLEHAPVDVRTPVENALLIVGQQLLNLNIRVESALAADLPLVRGDPNALEQVLLDLIANARDAMETTVGERVLAVRTRAATLDGAPAVALELEDSGPGIPADIRDKIFEPFFTTKGVGKGTGLGLAIVYGIVAAHGGRIDVASPPGKGARFTITLPADAAPAPAAA